MKISHLIEALDEAGARSAAQQASMKAAATGPVTRPNLQVQQGGKSATGTAATPNFGTGVPASMNPITVPGASSTPKATIQSQPGTAPSTAQAGPTGDPTLDQPLPAGPGLGSKIAGAAKKVLAPSNLAKATGQLAKAAGAIASVPQGMARAAKKGYSAGVQAVGGPGAATTAPTSAATDYPGSSSAGAAGANVSDKEFNDLISRVQKIEQILNRR